LVEERLGKIKRRLGVLSEVCTRRQVLVVRRNDCLDAGAPLSPLQPVEKPAERALESGGEGNRLENGQMFCFVLIILYSLYLEYDRPVIPDASGPAG
jgi:hypothetical protein